jgi:imidazolonepropionase-like amidohydrolase
LLVDEEFQKNFMFPLSRSPTAAPSVGPRLILRNAARQGDIEGMSFRKGRASRFGRTPLLSIVAVASLSACGGSGDGPAEAPSPAPPPEPPAGTPLPREDIAFTGINVVSTDVASVLPNQTVITRDGRISATGAAADVDVPPDVRIIEGAGRYLVPGLADMHVHMDPDDMPEYVRYGITTVRNMWGTPTVRTLREEVAGGTVAGPTIYSTSPGLDGEPPSWPFTRLVLDPADAEAAVAEQAAAGWPAIKIYQQLTAAVYEAIVEAARARNMPFMGHVPHRVGLFGVLDARQKSIEHLGGIDVHVTTVGGRGTSSWRGIDHSRVFEAVAAIRQAGTWVCPTLGVHRIFMQRFPEDERQAIIANQRFVLSELAKVDVGLLLGTDSGIDLTRPGLSLHEEIAEWTAAGLTADRILRALTVDAARFLGEDAEFGRIVIGLRADLLLVTGNPLEDPGVLAQPDGVMVRGHWMPAR